MSEGPEQVETAPEMTHSRAINLAFRWSVGLILVPYFLPLGRLGGGGAIQLVIPVIATLLAASWVHHSWKVALWMIPITCALLALVWFLLLILFIISAKHPG
ncbi:MAG TPA: hypothetical protein VL175_03860 [Pirellulales bacterium]|jgi:hypothetical protein|nr:hypothetical protein [Pirellulales bacterium]